MSSVYLVCKKALIVSQGTSSDSLPSGSDSETATKGFRLRLHGLVHLLELLERGCKSSIPLFESINFVIDEVDRVPVLRPFFAFDFTPTIETKGDFESWIFTLRKLFSFFCLIFYACALCFLSDCNFSLGSPDTDCSSNPKQNKTLLINQ